MLFSIFINFDITLSPISVIVAYATVSNATIIAKFFYNVKKSIEKSRKICYNFSVKDGVF